MGGKICIFEDQGWVNLSPLTLTRPAYELRCGMSSLKEKILRQFPGKEVILHCRDYLADAVAEENSGFQVNELPSDSCLFINGRVLADSDLVKKIDPNREGVYMKGEIVVASLLRGKSLEPIRRRMGQPLSRQDFSGLTDNVRQIEAKLIDYPWDLIRENASRIEEEFQLLAQGGEILGKIYENVCLIEKGNIYIGKDSKIKPGVVLDAEEGPIYIGEGVEVFPNATIQGPAFIGDGSKIKIGAKICEGTSIGEVCKVGGEVEETIIHSYSNKQHEGFLGHSYLGMWINLGADTNNSDLKNNYSTVKVYLNGQLVDTGSLFVGLFMGDHSKSGINTMFNTGTVVGVMSNVFGGDYPPKFIPSFAWGGSQGLVEHDLERALDTARRVMGRRDRELTPAQEKVLRKVFELTKPERERMKGCLK